MNSTLTAVLSPGRTACMLVCAHEDSQSPNLRSSILTFSHTEELFSHTYLLYGNTAGASQHHLIRSAPSRPADVAVAQNDLPPTTTIMRDRA